MRKKNKVHTENYNNFIRGIVGIQGPLIMGEQSGVRINISGDSIQNKTGLGGTTGVSSGIIRGNGDIDINIISKNGVGIRSRAPEKDNDKNYQNITGSLHISTKDGFALASFPSEFGKTIISPANETKNVVLQGDLIHFSYDEQSKNKTAEKIFLI